MNRILKVAKPNIVVMKLLAGGHKKETKVQAANKLYSFLHVNKARALVMMLRMLLFPESTGIVMLAYRPAG